MITLVDVRRHLCELEWEMVVDVVVDSGCQCEMMNADVEVDVGAVDTGRGILEW